MVQTLSPLLHEFESSYSDLQVSVPLTAEWVRNTRLRVMVPVGIRK